MTLRISLSILLAALVACAAASGSVQAQNMQAQDTQAQDAREKTWSQEKCTRYTKAYADARAKMKLPGLGAEFIQLHDAFLASGCTAQPNVCPRSEDEFRLANSLVIMGMNAGMASTFFPFACRGEASKRDMSADPRHTP